MKKFIKILIISLGIILLLLVAAPFLFKNAVVEMVKVEANKNVNAVVNFSDVKLSLLRNFPNLYTGIHGLVISGKGEFEADTLVAIERIAVTVDLMTLLKGDFSIRKIGIRNPEVNLIMLDNGMSNWDIAMESEGDDEPPVETVDTVQFKMELKSFKIENAIITYHDEPNKIYLRLDHLDHSLSGNLSADRTGLKTQTDIGNAFFEYAGIPYLKNVAIDLQAVIDADLKNNIYTFKKNQLAINDLVLNFDGSMGMAGDDLNFMMTFDTPDNDFKSILSLIPAIYAREFSDIQTNGNIQFDGYIKGLYKDDHYPSFGLQLNVSDAMFKYPDLPESVQNIQIDASINNRGGDLDNTIVDVKNISFQMANNPVRASIYVEKPVSDPYIKADANGKIEMANLEKVIPQYENESIDGTVVANFSFEGRLSDIENERYNQFKAMGSLLIDHIIYKNSLYELPFEIDHAQLNFAPMYLDLAALDLTMGSSDLHANGKIENYLSYILKDDVLKGTLTMQSEHLDINEILGSEVADSGDENVADNETDTDSIGVFVVPENLDFTLHSTLKKVIYQKMEMDDVAGIIIIKDKKINLDKLGMNVLGGMMEVNGLYDTWDADRPLVDFSLKMTTVNIAEVASKLFAFNHFAPFAEKIAGEFTGTFSLATLLDENMTPVYNNMNGKGNLKTSTMEVNGVNTMNALADYLKMDNLKEFTTDPVSLAFNLVDGILNVKPFDVKIGNVKLDMSGWTSFDKEIAYNLGINIPRNEFGEEANAVLNNLVSQSNQLGTDFKLGETVKLNAVIGGTLDNPKLEVDLAESGGDIINDLKKKGEEELQKKLAEAKEKASAEAQKIIDDADKQAKALIDEAKKQSDNIMKDARELADQGIQEAEVQAVNLEKEGKKNGLLAEVAAKTAAKELRKESEKQADKIIQEAQKQADALVAKANQEADKIRDDARQKAEKIK